MQSLQARLDSFSKTKRTKQSLTRSTSANALKWPHPPTYKATPRTLADAGFYFNPSTEDKDNVTCFMCGKELSDWDAEDDPFEVHWEKCRNVCPWAIAVCGLTMDLDERGDYKVRDPLRAPTSKSMEKARLDTFHAKQPWPHDTVKGHGASSKKMAKAGFVYTPQASGDDTATCLYCNLSLSGWDDDDDPKEEHLKRKSKSGITCPFFTAASSKPSKIPAAKETPSFLTPLNSDDELAAAPPSKGTGSKMSRAEHNESRTSTTVAKTPGSRRSARGTGKGSASRTGGGSEAEAIGAGGSESDAGKRVSKTKRKIKAQITVIEEEEEEEGEADVDPEESEAGRDDMEGIEPPKKPKRGRPPKNKKAAPVPKGSLPDHTDIEPVESAPVKKMHTRTRSRANLESESDVPVPSSSQPPHSRTKSTSKANSKAVIAEDKEPQEAHPPIAKSSGKRKPRTIEDPEAAGDVAPPVPKANARDTKVSWTKSKKVQETESESEARTVPVPLLDAQHEQSNRSQSAKATDAKPHTMVISRDSRQRTSISSISDDAGYATAEPPGDGDDMAVDDESEAGVVAQIKPMAAQAKARPTAHRSTTTSNGTRKKSRARELTLKVDEDTAVEEPTPRAPKTNGSLSSERSTPSETSSTLAAKPSRAGSRTTERSSGRGSRAKDKMAIVEISSDGEGDQAIDHARVRPPGVSSAPRITTSQDKISSNAPLASDSAKRKKMQVEVVIPIKVKKGPQDQSSKTRDISSIDAYRESDSQLPIVQEPSRPLPSTPTRSPRFSPLAQAGTESDALRFNTAGDTGLGEVPGSPGSYLPPMAILPIQKLASLTEEDLSMTVEQYIRREIEAQYQQLKIDAERQIDRLKEKAAETRRAIEAL